MPQSTRGVWISVLLGTAWTQACVAASRLMLPRHLALSQGVTGSLAFRVVAWTLLAPTTLSERLVALFATEASGESGRLVATIVLSGLSGMALCALCGWAVFSSRWRLAAGLLVASGAIAGLVGSAVVGLQLADARSAERAFFALVSHAQIPHEDPATVSSARLFVVAHPDSRWASEALRILADAEWDAGRVTSADRLWFRFGARFRDRNAPGVAYAEYSRSLCAERLGNRRAQARHLRSAIGVVRARADGIQSWIAVDAARRLARLDSEAYRYEGARYWIAKADTFARIYSIE